MDKVYDENGRPIIEKYSKYDSGKIREYVHFAYRYDDDGNQIKTENYVYEYDLDGKQTKATYDGLDEKGIVTDRIFYTYNKEGGIERRVTVTFGENGDIIKEDIWTPGEGEKTFEYTHGNDEDYNKHNKHDIEEIPDGISPTVEGLGELEKIAGRIIVGPIENQPAPGEEDDDGVR